LSSATDPPISPPQPPEPSSEPGPAGTAPEATPGAERLEEVSALREAFSERVISLGTMQPMVRVCSVVAIALLVCALVLGLLKGVHLPEAKLAIGNANPIVISLPALVLLLISFGLAWCYAVAAVLYAPVWLRAGVLALFAAAMLDQGSAFFVSVTSGRGPVLLVALALLSAAVVAHGWVTRGENPEPLSTGTERALAAGVFVLAGFVEVAAWWAARGAPIAGVFAVTLAFELTVFAVLANLFLSSAGADFAQAAHLVGSAAAAVVGAVPLRKLFGFAALALAAALLVRAVIDVSSSLPAEIGLALAGAAAIGAVAFHNRRRLAGSGRMPSWSAIVAGLLLVLVLSGGIAWETLTTESKSTQVSFKLPAPSNVYRHVSPPQFSIAIPPNWQVAPSATTVVFGGAKTGVPAVAEVDAFHLTRPIVGVPTAAQWRSALELLDSRRFANISFTTTAYPNRLGFVIAGKTPLQGIVAGSLTPTDEWVIQVLAQRAIWPDFATVANAMINSWRPNLRAVGVAASAPEPTGTSAGSTGEFGLIGFVLAAVLAGVMVVFRFRRSLLLTWLLLTGSMLFAGLADLNYVVSFLAGHTVNGVPHLSIVGIEAAVAIAIVIFAIPTLVSTGPSWLERLRAPLVPVVILAVALFILDELLNVYSGSSDSDTLLTVGGVTLLIGAFVWDVALSGDLTNHDGPRVRRPGRVLLYMSYMLAASAAVLYFGFAHELGPWAVHDYVFDPEEQTALSIGIVGVAYVVTLCIDLLMRTPAAEAAVERPAGPDTVTPGSDSDTVNEPESEVVATEVSEALEEL
jgi:hypothetical protein